MGALGYHYDSISSLMLLGARYYDSGIGRFITVDPAKEGTNWYRYAANRPITIADPSGELTGVEILILILVIGGALWTIGNAIWVDYKCWESLNALKGARDACVNELEQLEEEMGELLGGIEFMNKYGEPWLSEAMLVCIETQDPNAYADALYYCGVKHLWSALGLSRMLSKAL